MIIQYYWWIIHCNECTTTQIRAGVLGCEQGFALKFLEFDFRIRIRSPSSLSTIRNEGAVVAHGDVCAHVSLRASLSLRSCFSYHFSCAASHLSNIQHGWIFFFFDFCDVECPRLNSLDSLSRISLPGSRKIFDFCGLKVSKMKETAYLRKSSLWLKKILIFVVWYAPEWRIWTAFLRIFSPWLKKISDFRGLESARMKD